MMCSSAVIQRKEKKTFNVLFNIIFFPIFKTSILQFLSDYVSFYRSSGDKVFPLINIQ